MTELRFARQAVEDAQQTLEKAQNDVETALCFQLPTGGPTVAEALRNLDGNQAEWARLRETLPSAVDMSGLLDFAGAATAALKSSGIQDALRGLNVDSLNGRMLKGALDSLNGDATIRTALAQLSTLPSLVVPLPDVSIAPAWLGNIESSSLLECLGIDRPTPVFSPIPPSVEEPSVAEVEERCDGEIAALYASISDLTIALQQSELALEQSEKEKGALRRELTLRRLPDADEEYPQLRPEYFGKN